jgi:hypothetical protein
MTLNILRWQGGSGGDMLLKLISSSAVVQTNAKFQSGLSAHGKILLDQLHQPSQINYIAMDFNCRASIDPKLLKQELDQIISSDQIWWVKSHYYEQNFYTDCIVDIVVDHELLPFAVTANINKTTTMQSDFNPLVAKITDPYVRYQYSIYSLAKDFVYPYNTKRIIQLKQLLSGWDQLKNALDSLNISLDEKLKSFYQDWLTLNTMYMPTPAYQHLVKTQDYNMDHPDLTLVEKYCLLVLAGRKFQMLDQNEV